MIKKSNLVDFMLLICIKYLYVLVSVSTLRNLWYDGSQGYMIDFSLEKEIIASLIYIPMSILILNLKSKNNFSKSFFRILYVLYYIPLNSAYSIHNANTGFLIYSTIFVLLILLPNCIKFKPSNPRLKRCHRTISVADAKTYLNLKSVRLFFAIICFLFIIYKISYNGFSFSLSMDSDNVYGNRADYVESLQKIEGTLFAYVLTIIKNLAVVIAPFYLYIGLSQKKPVPIIISSFTILSIFSVTSSKSSVFIVLVVFGIFFLEQKNLIKHFDRIFLLGMVALFVLSIIESIFTNGISQIYFIILRRQMFIPSWLNVLYYDCFSQATPYFWSESAFLLQMFIPSPHTAEPLQIINDTYFQGLIPSPNTGLFAEAIMQCGIIGSFFYPIIYNLFIKITSVIYQRYGDALSIIMATQLVISLTNVPVLRTDFILGFMLLAIMLGIIPKIFFKKSRRLTSIQLVKNN